jgi:hypothetical protein
MWEISNEVGAHLQRMHAAMQAPPPAMPQPAPPPLPEPPMPDPVQHAHVGITEHEPAADPAAHFMSAPVSRDYAHASVEPDTIPGRVTLTAAEREIANLPGGPGEEEYGRQKLRLAKMKKAGLHKD